LERHEVKNSVIDNFSEFVATVCKWIRGKGFLWVGNSYQEDDSLGKHRVNLQGYAVNVIWEWGNICGFKAYNVQKIFFRAGMLYPTAYTNTN
jgi:hypothetical protein